MVGHEGVEFPPFRKPPRGNPDVALEIERRLNIARTGQLQQHRKQTESEGEMPGAWP